MTEPEPTYAADTLPADTTTNNLLQVRQFAIGLTIAIERLLEARGIPVESAVVTREERRNLTRERRK